MREPNQPATDALTLPNVFNALSDPVRLQVLAELDERGEVQCGDLRLDVPKSTLSHHLKVMREAGLTETRIEGTNRFISLREADLGGRFPGLLDSILEHLRKRSKRRPVRAQGR